MSTNKDMNRLNSLVSELILENERLNRKIQNIELEGNYGLVWERIKENIDLKLDSNIPLIKLLPKKSINQEIEYRINHCLIFITI